MTPQELRPLLGHHCLVAYKIAGGTAQRRLRLEYVDDRLYRAVGTRSQPFHIRPEDIMRARIVGTAERRQLD